MLQAVLITSELIKFLRSPREKVINLFNTHQKSKFEHPKGACHYYYYLEHGCEPVKWFRSRNFRTEQNWFILSKMKRNSINTKPRQVWLSIPFRLIQCLWHQELVPYDVIRTSCSWHSVVVSKFLHLVTNLHYQQPVVTRFRQKQCTQQVTILSSAHRLGCSNRCLLNDIRQSPILLFIKLYCRSRITLLEWIERLCYAYFIECSNKSFTMIRIWRSQAFSI